MQAIAQVVLPFFALIALGYLAARRGVIVRTDVEGLTKFVYWFPLPALLFRGIATREFSELASPRLLIAYALSTVLLFALLRLIFRRVYRLPRPEAVFHSFGSVQANNGFLAIPLMPALFGEQAVAPLALTLFADMLLLYPLGFVMADLASARPQSRVALVRTVARTFYANPFLIAMLLALAVAASGLSMPGPLSALVTTLAQAGPPVALFVLGASLALHRTRMQHADEISLMTFTKLVVHPAVFALIGLYVVPLSPLHLAVGIAVAALPTGINVYMFSRSYVARPEIYSAAIMTSTALSVVTFSVVVWLVGRWGLV